MVIVASGQIMQSMSVSIINIEDLFLASWFPLQDGDCLDMQLFKPLLQNHQVSRFQGLSAVS